MWYDTLRGEGVKRVSGAERACARAVSLAGEFIRSRETPKGLDGSGKQALCTFFTKNRIIKMWEVGTCPCILSETILPP